MADQPIDALRRLFRPFYNRIVAGIARGIVHAVNNATKVQNLQTEALRDEVRDGVENFQPYGFESVPLAGAEVLLVHVGNSRDHPIAAQVTDGRYRPTDGVAGMVGIYDDQGQTVRIFRDRIEISTPNKVVLTAPTIEVVGDLSVDGEITATGDVADATGTLADLRTAYNSHTHISASPGAPTGPPTPTV